MTEPVLKIDRSDRFVRLTLNRPDRLNAFSADLHVALRDALDEVEQSPTLRCLVITGQGRAFCAGQDLSERKVAADAPPVDIGAMLDRDLNPLVQRLRALPMPVIAAVNGTAAGAGASLALAADVVVAARSARFTFAFTRLGLGPDGGLSWRLPRLVGAARAGALALLAESVSAQQAQDWGMIWRCVEDDQLTGSVDALIAHLVAQPRDALASTKQALETSWGRDFGAQLEAERQAQQTLGFSADYREGLTAFFEKRPPRYGP